MRRASAVCLIVLLCAVPVARGQDTRVVTEPRVPAVCARVAARLTSAGAGLAPGDERRLDTTRIQQALDACAPGQAVELDTDEGRNAFLSGPLELRRGVVLLVSGGVTLYASRDPRVYDVRPGSCGIVTADDGRGCRPLVHAGGVADAGVMGDGAIDGRGGATLLDQRVSWWDLAEQARADQTLHQNCPRIIVAEQANNFVLYRITLRNSPNFHVSYSRGDGFTAWGVVIDAPKTSRNTDGIDPSSSTNVTIAHSFIRAGDDSVAIKAGNAGPATRITVAHNHFYNGHGMSIGSETNGGVRAVRVNDLSIEGADNGLRIKSNASRGGLVQDVVYEDVCIRDTKNPIVMDSTYPFFGAERDKLPTFTGIVLRGVAILGKGKISLQGYDAAHRLGIRFDGLVASNPDAIAIEASEADIALGPGAVNLNPTGPHVVVTGTSGLSTANACANRFAPFPTK